MYDVQLACRNLKGSTGKGKTPGAGSKPSSSGGTAKSKSKSKKQSGKKPTTKRSKAAPKEAA